MYLIIDSNSLIVESCFNLLALALITLTLPFIYPLEELILSKEGESFFGFPDKLTTSGIPRIGHFSGITISDNSIVSL